MDIKYAKILAVDDEKINQQILAAMLKKCGYEHLIVSSGQEALELVDSYEPDLLLLDVMMPEMDGFQVVQALKKNTRTRPIPIILVTALTDRQSRIKGLSAGAEDCITKPIDGQELSIRIRNLLRLKKLNDFLRQHNRTLAQYDTLTGLPNRSLLRDHLVHELVNS
ncbi:MAG: response regulator, partial [Magnetococcales bacterium]|nr:response regulator [Magnetococcales bacterium]